MSINIHYLINRLGSSSIIIHLARRPAIAMRPMNPTKFSRIFHSSTLGVFCLKMFLRFGFFLKVPDQDFYEVAAILELWFFIYLVTYPNYHKLYSLDKMKFS